MYILGILVFKHVQSENFRWWDGYIDQAAVHVEEMDDHCKMPPGRLKDFLDTGAIRVERSYTAIETSNHLLYFQQVSRGDLWPTLG